MQTEETSERDLREAVAAKPWQSYLEAALGFRNHWYPALFSAELGYGAAAGVEPLGERILLKRVGATVYAIEDRCAHRGVPFSARVECYTESTITCWYHGFTYDLRDGRLVAIVTDPDSSLPGKVSRGPRAAAAEQTSRELPPGQYSPRTARSMNSSSTRAVYARRPPSMMTFSDLPY